ncbi:response regulator [Steroidobacter agaridevorans]|uniref:Response regulator n=1 Tax=Steroidobacter agaridevorans TaxID=2695856 RepID=A0A829Y9S9_9GAMM|nr:response regulator [Steroidobacter agaridevorans]GFE80077.1 response regulator [Steroidobacter agaridevorans]GFE89953.1 response regulator [Steroidobacter agaridevorans]
MPSLDGASVLLLEDEFVVALDAEQMLQELGVVRVETAATLSEAEARARAGHFDVAVLDVNINGQMSFDLAESLRARGTAVVFATGYELKDRALPNIDSALCVSKPYTSERLRQALCAALAEAK